MGEGRGGVDDGGWEMEDGRLRLGEWEMGGCGGWRKGEGGGEGGGGNDGGRETICDESEEGMRGVRRGMEDGRMEA